MKLSPWEREMLEGKNGAGVQKAMELLVAVGKAFDAECLVDVTRTHSALSAQEGDTYWCDLLASGGARCKVPCTTNPGWNEKALSKLGQVTTEELNLLHRTYAAYNQIGAVMSLNCTPELEFNPPRFGEIVAFSESSATPYVNAVLGARSNRESSVSALASAVIGKTPLYGLLLDENRLGNLMVTVDFIPQGEYEWGLLGYHVGKLAGKHIPVLKFPEFQRKPRPEDLLYFCAEGATSGCLAMFHIIGITPEAPTQTAALGHRSPVKTVAVTRAAVLAIEAELSDPAGEIDMVILGCPHYTYAQVCQLNELIAGRRSKVPFFVLVSDTTLAVAARSGHQQRLEESGVTLVSGTCVDQPCFKSFEQGSFVTDSPKAAFYREGRGQKGIIIRCAAECVQAALQGRVVA